MKISNNNKALCFCCQLLFGMFFSSLAEAASQQDIQQLRSLSYAVVSNVLAYHNPFGSPYDLSVADTYHRDMAQLLQRAQQLGLPEITAQARQLDSGIAALQDQLPQSASETRGELPPYWCLAPVIEQQNHLADRLSELYASQPAVDAVTQVLHELSRDLGRLSLSYQISSFSYLVTEAEQFDEAALVELDESIRRRLTELPTIAPQLAPTLEKLPGRYHFVRSRALSPTLDRAPSAVARYLLGMAQTLDSAAGKLGP